MDFVKIYNKARVARFKADSVVNQAAEAIEEKVTGIVLDKYNLPKTMENGAAYEFFKANSKVNGSKVIITIYFALIGKMSKEKALLLEKYKLEYKREKKFWVPYTYHKPALFISKEYSIDIEDAVKGNFSLKI